MFDLSWGEMAVVGVVALVVLGPKELPNALRTITNLTKTARKLAQGVSKGSISKAIEKAVDPTGDLKTTIKGVETEAKGTSPIPAISNPTVERTKPLVAGPTVQRGTEPAAAVPASASPAAAAAVGEVEAKS